MPQKKTLFSTSAIILATILWGMTFSFIKDAIASLSPYNFLFWRFGVASLLLLILFWRTIRFTRKILYQGFILGLLLTGTMIFLTIGLLTTSASIASFISATSVVLVAIWESIAHRRWPSWYLLFAVLLSMLGVGLVTLQHSFKITVGDWWVLLSACSFAGYVLFADKASKSNAEFSLVCLQSLLVGLLTGILALLTTGIVVPKHIHVWVAVLFCSIFASIIAFMLELRFQKYVKPTQITIIFALEPVFATITAAIYLHEKLSVRFFMGALLIFFAILLAEQHSRKKILPQE